MREMVENCTFLKIGSRKASGNASSTSKEALVYLVLAQYGDFRLDTDDGGEPTSLLRAVKKSRPE